MNTKLNFFSITLLTTLALGIGSATVASSSAEMKTDEMATQSMKTMGGKMTDDGMREMDKMKDESMETMNSEMEPKKKMMDN